VSELALAWLGACCCLATVAWNSPSDHPTSKAGLRSLGIRAR